jgi:hypothetical protein
MKRMCRRLRVRPEARRKIWQELFPHARIITDPKKMAQLNADVAQRRREDVESNNLGRSAGAQPCAARSRHMPKSQTTI